MARCPSFDACEACTCCTKFDRHSLSCARCERVKLDDATGVHGRVCQHNDRQQYNVVQLSALTRSPLLDPNRRAVEINIPTAGNPVWEELSQSCRGGLGQISPVRDLAAEARMYGVISEAHDTLGNARWGTPR
jgi:hypothetical protein